MMSLARRHRERMLAAAGATQVALEAGTRTGAAASEYELIRARLGVDIRLLKEIQSIERKIERKRELVPAYFDWIAGVLEADAPAQDDVLTQVMIWTIDIGDWDSALPMARHVLRHRLPLPERFDRTAPTLICEEIADAALKALGQDQPFDLAVLEEVAALVDGADIFDQVRAKLEKARGLASARAAEAVADDADGPAGQRRGLLARARTHLGRALELDAKAGVKKRIEQIDRALRPAAGAGDA